jgi:8-oxo-dGTP pyrophosphatase MutT (NUDIX family)
MQPARQIAALPVRLGGDGALQVLLITSRGRRRWVIPKGWPWPGCAEPDAAAGEAWEEAGITGTLGSGPIGAYTYSKRRVHKPISVQVSVFLLIVSHEHPQWPEQRQRRRAWFAQEEAARVVEERELGALIGSLAVGDVRCPEAGPGGRPAPPLDGPPRYRGDPTGA